MTAFRLASRVKTVVMVKALMAPPDPAFAGGSARLSQA